MSLQEIDALIKQTDYDQALGALSEFIKNNPERLDQAQRRVDSIMRARSYYTRLANELLDVMENEPENAEKKLAIIKELESLEKKPSQEHLAFINQAKNAAEFTYYRAQFRRIMEGAAKDAHEQKYPDSIALLQSGFYMYRDEFYDENPAAVTDEATKVVGGLTAACADYLALRSACNDARKSFVQAADGGIQGASRSWENFESHMKNFALVRNRVSDAGGALGGIFERLKKANPELTEASYLSFMNRFALGIASIQDSGVLGTMDYEWGLHLDSCVAALHKAARQKFDDYIKTAQTQKALEPSFAPDAARLSEADRLAALALDVCALESLKRGKGSDGALEKRSAAALSMRAAKNFVLGTNASVENLERGKAASARLSALPLPAGGLESARSGDAYSESLLDIVKALEDTRKNAEAALAEPWYAEYKNSYDEQSGKKDSGKKTGEAAESREQKVLDFGNIMGYYQALNDLILRAMEKAGDDAWKKLCDRGEALAGLVSESYGSVYSEAEDLAARHYPDKALEKAEGAQKNLSADKAMLEKARSNLLKRGEKAQGSVEKINAALATLDGLRAAGVEIAQKARQEILLAQSALTQADEVFRRAQSSFQAENFTAARNNLQRARELYNESLGHQESDAVRARSDRNLADLGQRINDAENKIIVTEVRALKTRAKNEYYAGNFESAESLLNRAESRWAVTNVEEDEEIKNLKLLVQNALSMKTGREIKPTAPLYPEMSQILSNARQYFDKGSALIKSGRREEALPILEEAKKKIQELQLVYPLNKEASLLSLRIDELVDPERFNESFARRVQAARQNVKVAATQRQAYSDLLDLAEIRPDYPGLKKLLYDVEIEIGVRQKPVDQAALRRSESLAKEARGLYEKARGNEEVLRQALARLDQAIALNPNNEAAITLKDRIQIAVGGKAAVVLSSADEASYNRAIQELRNNNVVGAYTIVERLLQNPANRRSSKILDLQKQVQARM